MRRRKVSGVPLDILKHQEREFLSGEADAWYKRNKEGLLHYGGDVFQTYLLSLPLRGKKVLDIGCSVGHTLALLAERGADCWGTEPSALAVKEGSELYPALHLQQSLSHELSQFADETFDIVLMSFVFHWVERSRLLRTVGEMDRVLKKGGYLIMQDFYPDVPHKRPYHHRTDVKLFTYKQPYWDIFTASNIYTEIRRIPFSHDLTRRQNEDISIQGSDTAGLVVAFRRDLEARYPVRDVTTGQYIPLKQKMRD